MSKKSDKKKKKVTYVDDGSTIADMSGVSGGFGGRRGGNISNLEDKKTTFFRAQRQMFVPMLIVMGFLSLIFLIAYILLSLV